MQDQTTEFPQPTEEVVRDSVIADVINALGKDKTQAEAIRIRLKEDGERVARFNGRKLGGRDKEGFLADLQSLEDLRLACIVDQFLHFGKYPPISKEDRQRFLEIAGHFGSFRLISPGSSYIAGMENENTQSGLLKSRQRSEYADKIRKLLDEIKDYRLRPFIIENGSLIDDDVALARKAGWNYPVNGIGGEMAGAISTVFSSPSKPDYLKTPIYPKYAEPLGGRRGILGIVQRHIKGK